MARSTPVSTGSNPRPVFAASSARSIPNIPRRVSGYNLNYLLPENGFDVARALSALKAPALLFSGHLSPGAKPAVTSPAPVAYPDIYQCADHVPEFLRTSQSASRELTTCWSNTHGAGGSIPKGWRSCLKAGDGCWQNSARPPCRSRGPGIRLMDSSAKAQTLRQIRLFTDQKQIRQVWEVRESSLGVISYVPGEPSPGKAGKTRRWRQKSWAVSARPAQTDERFDYRGTLYGHFGDGCVHTRMNFDL